MKKKDKYTGHTLKTRRDFVAHGLLSGAGVSLAPSLFTLLKTRQVLGTTCTSFNPLDRLPVLVIDLAGGGHLAGGNVLAGGRGGQSDFLNSYQYLGLPDNTFHPRNYIDSSFNLLFHGDSGILRGMKDQTSARIRSKVDGAIQLGFTENDTLDNPSSPIYWLAKAGARGSLFDITTHDPSVSGAQSNVPTSSISSDYSKINLRAPSDLAKMADFGQLSLSLSNTQVEKTLNAIERLSEAKLRDFSRRTLPDQLRSIASASLSTSKLGCQSSLYRDLGNVDAASNPLLTSKFNFNDGQDATYATNAHALFQGYTGISVIEHRGMDYHGQLRGVAEEKDESVGRIIGKFLTLANEYETDLFIYVLTDGGVVNKLEVDNTPQGRGKYNWSGDASNKSAAMMLYYKHSGNVKMNQIDGQANRQIGWLKEVGNNQVTDYNATLISNNVTNMAKCAVLNYLALQGREGQLESIVGDNPFRDEMNNYIAFGKNRS